MQAFENHRQWNAVKEVCRRLKESGHVTLLAGGCVRDFLMNRDPNDFDIATSATPDQVEALYPNAVMVGKAFGVSILPFNGFQIEVATFREDLEYKDGRRPEGVRFSSPEEDSKRRDFTVNALFYDIDNDKVVDYVGGEADIKKKIIRTVGDPQERFTEDKLRLLRAVRFAAQLEFEIAPETLSAVTRLAPEVHSVSRERVRDEVVKLLRAKERDVGLRLMLATGLFQELFPNLAPVVLRTEAQWLKRFSFDSHRDRTVSLALFFSPAFTIEANEKDFRERHLKDLRLDNKQIEAIVFAIKNSKYFLNPETIRLGELILLLAHVDALCARQYASVLAREAVTTDPEIRLKEISLKYLGTEFMKPSAFLSGESAKELGLKPGARMGELLKEAYLLQLEKKLIDPDQAKAWLKAQLQ
jgi:tRNA nucleotidyltransferase (CCA-adding enzyme)